MTKKILLGTFLFIGSLLFAQHPTCDGDRYRVQVFDEVKITTGLKFGEGTTIGGNFQELKMDIYEPVGDDVEKRPAIVLAFGGSFIFGAREDMDFLCRDYAKRGYVAATIDYRLYDAGIIPFPDEQDMLDVVTKAISDMKAAIRFLREDAATTNQFKIDSDFIFSGGISAGAITAAHVAVMDSTDEISDEIMSYIDLNGGFEGNSSSNYEYSSEVQGFVNFSGALREADWITSDDPPFISVHEEFDGTVPYGMGFAQIFGLDIAPLEGSKIMHEVADSVGVENQLHTLFGAQTHVGYFGSNGDEIIDMTAEFLYDILCPEMTNVDDFESELADISIYPNPTNGLLYLKKEAQLSLDLTLFNSLGQPMTRVENTNQIDLSAYEKGFYFLEILNPKTNSRTVKRVVLEK